MLIRLHDGRPVGPAGQHLLGKEPELDAVRPPPIVLRQRMHPRKHVPAHDLRVLRVVGRQSLFFALICVSCGLRRRRWRSRELARADFERVRAGAFRLV